MKKNRWSKTGILMNKNILNVDKRNFLKNVIKFYCDVVKTFFKWKTKKYKFRKPYIIWSFGCFFYLTTFSRSFILAKIKLGPILNIGIFRAIITFLLSLRYETNFFPQSKWLLCFCINFLLAKTTTAKPVNLTLLKFYIFKVKTNIFVPKI